MSVEKMEDKDASGETEWIPKEYYSRLNLEETTYEKLIRKCRETPAVPLGILATIGALTYGLFNFYKGKKMNQQYAMRARVGFQGFTLLAIMYSMYCETERRAKQKEKEMEGS